MIPSFFKNDILVTVYGNYSWRMAVMGYELLKNETYRDFLNNLDKPKVLHEMLTI